MSVTVWPEFQFIETKDLMVRGGNFYAIWDTENNIWSTDIYRARAIIDKALYEYAEEYKQTHDDTDQVHIRSLLNSSTKSFRNFKEFMKDSPDNFIELDRNLTFASDVIVQEDYRSKRLKYDICEGSIEAYDRIMGTLWAPEQRTKLEWAIGSIISGDSKHIQKFIVMYGAPGTGKSTVIKIINALFDGYTQKIVAQSIARGRNFATGALKNNPLVAFDEDSDMSHVFNDAGLNSLISHEEIRIDDKYEKAYNKSVDAFIFMGTNSPVEITSTNAGMLRRMIDVYPTGDRIPFYEFDDLLNKATTFELGAIAHHCLSVYEDLGKTYFDAYTPKQMLKDSNPLHNFMLEYSGDGVSDVVIGKTIFKQYVEWCDNANIVPMSKPKFFTELRYYFASYKQEARINGAHYYNVFSDFKDTVFKSKPLLPERKPEPQKLILDKTNSIFDDNCWYCRAQLASETSGYPQKPWNEVTTVLKDIDTHKLHYVQLPANHIVIDLDIKNQSGEKSADLNLARASEFPATYTELSKSGGGVHLHYIYDGDPSELSSIFEPGIEIKVFKGNMALRRKLTYCNDLNISHLAVGSLPLKKRAQKKGGVDMLNMDAEEINTYLRRFIESCFLKKHHGATKPEVDFIKEMLDRAYDSGKPYDVRNMEDKVLTFCSHSTNQAEYCIKQFDKMKFRSKEPIPGPAVVKASFKVKSDANPIVFFDVEVFPNLFVICWKIKGDEKNVNRMINPTPEETAKLMDFNLVGFNNRKYDNHILYARAILRESNAELFERSQGIVSGDADGKSRYGYLLGPAYNLSYADIYDFSSKKQSLKKFEIELGIHHQELGLPWDQPVDETLWGTVADYCANDVIATEATFNARKQDFIARQVLSDLSGLTVMDTTRAHITKIIFGDDAHPELVYTDLSELFPGYSYGFEETRTASGHKAVTFQSIYRGEITGEGGYVWAEPGYYTNVALLDVESMHPHSLVELNLFGEHTQRFKDILDARLAIKHKNFDAAKMLLGGALTPYLESEDQAKNLAQALKIIINSVYGYTKASFDCPFKDPRNIDNIVAKRGSLFMIDLKHAVQEQGYIAAHIKTDSIKIPDADDYIINFVKEFGKHYGYTFEHEATYEKMCLVNNAVYIAKDANDGVWKPTGAQFKHPYVFKTMFSKEPIVLEDLGETKEVKSSIYLDFNESNESDHIYHYIGKVGLFVPVLPGSGGGLLVKPSRTAPNKYDAVTGTSGYRWRELEQVKLLNKEKDIDYSYYNNLVDVAKDAIGEYIDPDIFCNNKKETVQ